MPVDVFEQQGGLRVDEQKLLTHLRNAQGVAKRCAKQEILRGLSAGGNREQNVNWHEVDAWEERPPWSKFEGPNDWSWPTVAGRAAAAVGPEAAIGPRPVRLSHHARAVEDLQAYLNTALSYPDR